MAVEHALLFDKITKKHRAHRRAMSANSVQSGCMHCGTNGSYALPQQFPTFLRDLLQVEILE